MEIKKFINSLLLKQADFNTPETIEPPISPSPPSTGEIGGPPTETPTPQSPAAPKKIYPTEFKKWFKFKGFRDGKKHYDILGYFINISNVDPSSLEGKELSNSGYKFDVARKNFAKMMKVEEDVKRVKIELSQIEKNTGVNFDKKWEQQALEIFPETPLKTPELETPVEEGGPIETAVEGVLGDTQLTNDRKKEITDKYVRAKIEELAKMTEEAREKVLKEMLAVNENFHGYSFINRILMMLQKKDVSPYVAGKGAWENNNGKLRRKLKEGETPMNIFAPEQYKIYAAVAQKILDSLIAYQNKVGNHYIIKDVEFIANGMGITNFYSKHFLGFAAYMGKMTLEGTIEWIEKQLNSPSTKLYKAIYYGSKKNAFKMVPVYDVTQTEPIDQNSFNPEDRDEKFLGPNAPDQLALPLLNAAVDWAKTASYQVGSEWKKGINIDMAKEMAMGTGGWSENSGDIAINKMSQGWRQFATVVHEITHTLLHWGPDKGDITRSQKEIEAEATVYIVLDYFGYQDTQFVANYLNLHAKTGQDVLDRYEKIDKAARNIIKGINEFLNKKAASGNWFNVIKLSSLGLLNKEINF